MYKSIQSLLFIFFCVSVYAQNEAKATVTYVYPTDKITIDGDISDWSKDLKSHKISQRTGGVAATGTEDFSAHYKIAYNKTENLLYLAIVIEDDVIDQSTAKDWSSQDSYSLYIDEQYHKKGSGVTRYTWCANAIKDLLKTNNNWDPKLTELTSWDKISHQKSIQENTIIHELAFKVATPLYVGRVMKMAHLIIDSDTDGITGYSDNRRRGKDRSSQPARLNPIIFADHTTKLGTITGNVAWNDETIPMSPSGIRIQSQTDANFWLYIPLQNSDKSFAVNLPEGKYLLKPGMITHFNGNKYAKADMSKTKAFSIKANEKLDIGTYVQMTIPAPKFNTSDNILHQKKNQLHAIDDEIKKYMDYYEIEGVSFATFHKGKITYQKQYGVKNAYTGEKLDQNTLFEVASITKPVIAYTVLKLVEKGVLDLDQPLHKILPFKMVQENPYAKLLTARIILSHRSGLPNWPQNGKLEFMFEPGSQYGYSGTAYEYLGRVLEKLTNKDINTILKEEVNIPLGISNFYYQKHPNVGKHKSHGHHNGFPGKIDQPDTPWIAGSLITNIDGLAKFVFALQRRIGLKKSSFDLMFSEIVTHPKKSRENIWDYEEYIGLGIFVEKAPHGLVFKHSGNNGDFKAIFKIYDGLDMGYMLLTNGNTGHFIIENIEKTLLNPDAS